MVSYKKFQRTLSYSLLRASLGATELLYYLLVNDNFFQLNICRLPEIIMPHIWLPMLSPLFKIT
jgi:hypothetical protein